MWTTPLTSVVGALLLAAAAAAAQVSVFRSRTDLTVVTVSVQDRQGHQVSGLTADRFEIREDNAPRPVAALATGAEPLSLVVAVDTSESMEGRRFEFARQAVAAIFEAHRPDDDYYVLGFNDRVFPIAPGSQSIDTVQRGFDRAMPFGTTALYDAVTTAVDTLRMAANRRRAVIVISDGNDYRRSDGNGSTLAARRFERASRAIERVRRSEARVYAIGIDSPPPPGQSPDKTFIGTALKQLTDPTGGTTIIVRTDAAVPGAAAAIVDDLRQQYVLGFESAHPEDGRFHRLDVRVSGCDCRVRTRREFLSPRPEDRQ